jgi:hypothetical protein
MKQKLKLPLAEDSENGLFLMPSGRESWCDRLAQLEKGSAMKTYICTLTLPNGKAVVAKARSESLDREVQVDWSGATVVLGPIPPGKQSVGFLRWYLEARALHLQGRLEFKIEDGGGS